MLKVVAGKGIELPRQARAAWPGSAGAGVSTPAGGAGPGLARAGWHCPASDCDRPGARQGGFQVGPAACLGPAQGA